MKDFQLIIEISKNLRDKGYLIGSNPIIQGIRVRLYSYSPFPFRLGFAKVRDHFLFVDWNDKDFKIQNPILEVYRPFQTFVNQSYKVPHVWRMTIPNLILVFISESGFRLEAVNYVQRNYQVPWYGGETGQIMLYDLEKRQLFFHKPPKDIRHTSGAFPLIHGLDVLQRVFQESQGDNNGNEKP